jgi:hypothetical protein
MILAPRLLDSASGDRVMAVRLVTDVTADQRLAGPDARQGNGAKSAGGKGSANACREGRRDGDSATSWNRRRFDIDETMPMNLAAESGQLRIPQSKSTPKTHRSGSVKRNPMSRGMNVQNCSKDMSHLPFQIVARIIDRLAF